MSFRHTIVFIMAFVCPLIVWSQQFYGLKLDQYGGPGGIWLNPAQSASSPYSWNANVVSAGGHFSNNYSYFENEGALSLLRKVRPEIFIATERNLDDPVVGSSIAVRFDEVERDRFTHAVADVYGPHIQVRLDDLWTAGMFFNIRGMVSGLDIPKAFGYHEYSALDDEEMTIIDAMKITFGTWAEMGFNLSTTIEAPGAVWQVGGSMKLLFPFEGLSLVSDQSTHFSKWHNDSLRLGGGDYTFQFTTSNGYQKPVRIQNNGMGVSVDMGVQVSDAAGMDYRWKLGMSVLDLGSLRYNTNAEMHRGRTEDAFYLPPHLGDFTDLETFAKGVSYEMLGDSAASMNASAFSIGTPATLSFQAEYRFASGFALSAIRIQRIPFQKISLQRMNQWAVVGRYEHPWFTVGLPVIIPENDDVKIGLYGRFGLLQVGTDDLASIFGRSDWTGTNVYAGLIVHPFATSERYASKKAGRIKCYRF